MLVASGAYLLVYLYRGEWNRALISGLFFVASEVALIAGLLGRRLGRLERDLGELRREQVMSTSPVRSDERPDGASDGPVSVFRWLEPDSLGVFVPVLLGVGAILSALAYVVERLAAVATSGTPRTSHDRLAPLARPS